MKENDFFHKSDPRYNAMAGFELPKGWWSRPWEYHWAIQYNDIVGGVVANMGAGFTYRPFTDALAHRAGVVQWVDTKRPTWNLLDHPIPPNVEIHEADFSKEITSIAPASLDRIFCISVLEENIQTVAATLKEFKRLLAPDGLIVLTFDVQYDMSRPLGQYKGLELDTLMAGVLDAGLKPREKFHFDKEDAVFHEEFNLTPYHCVLVK